MKFAILVSCAMACVSTAAIGAPKPQALEGEWISDCSPTGKGGRHGQIIHLTLTKDRIRAAGQLYASANCDSPTLKGQFWGKLRKVRANKERLELDYEFAGATFTLQRDDVVDHYNTTRGCGLDKWQANVAKSVSGSRCGPLDLPQPGQKLFESAWLNGDELRMGAFPHDTSNRSPANRPSSPKPLIFRRVKDASR
jgi:hypothetical protein